MRQYGKLSLQSVMYARDKTNLTKLSIPNGSTLVGNDFAHTLQQYDYVAKEIHFNNTKYRCPVCFDRLQGVECVSLTYCEHIACKGCLKDGWSLYISEGRSELVGCPDPQCVKSKRLASMQDVQTVLSPEEVARWLWLIRKKETEKGAC